MRQLILAQVDPTGRQRTTVSDFAGTVYYHLLGDIGYNGATLVIHDVSGTAVAQITQTATGLLPRFELQAHGLKVGSIGLSLQIRDIIFVSGLNWLISGSALKNHYQIHHFQHLLMNSYPKQDMRQSLDIYDVQHEALLVLIAGFLNHWRLNADAYRHPWRNMVWAPQNRLAVTFRAN